MDPLHDPRTETFQRDLADAVAEGWVYARRHDTLPLTLYCYTRKVQYDMNWTPVTSTARGLVLADDGTPVIWPLRKFHQARHLTQMPAGTPMIVEKLDGSMVGVARYDGQLVTATKGSFDSSQAAAGRQLLTGRYDPDAVEEQVTYVFELLHPGNRIVVEYSTDPALVLLMARDNVTGVEHDLDRLRAAADRLGVMTPSTYDHLSDLDPQQLENLDWDNAEGFVLSYPDGQRVKVKFANYVDLHALRTAVPTARRIWDMLRRGVDVVEMIEDLPDEYDGWVAEQAEIAHRGIDDLEEAVLALAEILDVDPSADRRQVAARVFGSWPVQAQQQLEAVGARPKTVTGLLMAIYDGQELDRTLRDDQQIPVGVARAVWDHVEPDADVTPPAADLSAFDHQYA